MFDNLHLFGRRNVNDQHLLRLGKINVLCGKNNSGKSTILECILNSDNRSNSYIADEDFINNIINRLQFMSNHPYFKKRLIDIFKSYLNKSFFEITSQELKDLIIKVANFINPDLLEDVNLIIRDEFIGLINNIKPPIALIPPRRRFSFSGSIKSSLSVSSDGDMLLERLFYAQNRLDTDSQKKLFNDLIESFHEISGGYTFSLQIEDEINIRLYFKNNQGEWIFGGEMGLGMEHLLIILYFCFDPSNHVLLIEEPEVHLHPEIQRKLLSFMKHKVDKQIFISTHSNIFLDNTFVNKIYLIQYDNEIKVKDETSKSVILNDLGYTVADNLLADMVILTEGPSDKPVIEQFLDKMGLYSQYNIKIWPLGGDIMAQLDLSIFSEGYKVMALIDNDPKSNSIRELFIRNCEEYNIPVCRLERYAIENYFTIAALREVFKAQIPNEFNEVLFDVSLFTQININVKKNNYKIAKAMDIGDIKGTDLYDFLLDVESRLKQ